jgi:hypothetical protein
MAINYLTTANTFQQWLIGTQDLITVANNLTDNISGTFYANTNLVVGNTLNVVGNTTITGDLTVSGNITLDTVGFDDLSVAGSGTFANTLSVTGNSTFSNANVTSVLTANIARITTAEITSANITTTTGTIASANITTANIVNLVGTANTAIYAAISNAEGTALAFSIALG